MRDCRAVAALALASFLLSACTGDERPNAERKVSNLLLVVVDTLRADHIGAQGYERETTPNIDAFAAAGAKFSQAIAHSSWTRPSMAALMTGVLPSTTGLTCHNFRFPKGDCDVLRSGLTTLAELLAESGFATSGIVANINVDSIFGFDQGFEEYVSIPERLQAANPDWRTQKDWLRGTTEGVTEAAVAWLEQSTDDAPFFLYLHYLDPHEPYLPPAEDVKPVVKL